MEKSPEIDTHIYHQLIWQSTKEFNEQMTVLINNGAETTRYPYGK